MMNVRWVRQAHQAPTTTQYVTRVDEQLIQDKKQAV